MLACSLRCDSAHSPPCAASVDVYSLGVLLYQMLAGKETLDRLGPFEVCAAGGDARDTTPVTRWLSREFDRTSVEVVGTHSSVR